MRIGEFSKRSGVPVSTIKYYLREGLLPAGERTGPNQARYDDGHLRRLKLVRALVDVGGLSIAAVREVLGAVDGSEEPLHDVLGLAQRSITTAPAVERDEVAEQQAREFLAARGWMCSDDNPALRSIVAVLTTARELGHDHFLDQLSAYTEPCRDVARSDVEYVLRRSSVEDAVEGLVVGTVLGDRALAAMRRLAQMEMSASRAPREAAGE
jgi:DNA-binding transcriptional MerR regulator